MDIGEAIKRSLHSGDHQEIHKILNDRKMNLRSIVYEEKGEKTVLRKLLDDAVNGDKIVQKQLDKDVKPIGANENCLDYGTEIDFEGIFEDGSLRQTRVVKELLDLRASCREGDGPF